MTVFSSYERNDIYNQLEKETLDVLVIGGGITGSGIALDAVTRGLKTGLVEMKDFAFGTSSRSTKLVHGGLRYLKQLEIKIVAEVGKERAIVYENGPHVTTPEWMMLPFHAGGTFGPFTTNIGLMTYDFLAGVKKGERRKMFSREEALEREPLLKEDGLKGAGYYVEYKTDDARLTIEVMKKAVEQGAHAINYAKVIDFIYESTKVVGVIVEDQITGDQHKIYAKKIINAAGPWVDTLREIDGSKQGKTLHLTKGVHLVFDQSDFPLQQAIYFDTPDKRMVFAIPREGKTYVGTTDTFYDADIAHPTMTVEDRDYLIDAINYMFPTLNMTAEKVESSWSGLRPLIAENGKKPGEISRKDEIFISDSGLISMAGGKLTGYRKMAQDVMDIVVKQFKQEEGILFSDSETLNMPISGGDVGGSKGFAQFKAQKMAEGAELGIEATTLAKLIQQYGANVDQIFRIYTDQKETSEKAKLDPIVFAELVYALEHELTYTPADFFMRRTGAIFFDINWVYEHKESVITYMEKQLRWTKDQTASYRKELEQLLKEAVIPTE